MALGPVMLDVEGLTLTPADRDLLREPAVGGVILFSRNYASPDQLADLVAAVIRKDLPPVEKTAAIKNLMVETTTLTLLMYSVLG